MANERTTQDGPSCSDRASCCVNFEPEEEHENNQDPDHSSALQVQATRYHWAQGITLGAPVILIEVETDEGVTGIGESVASPTIEPVLAIIDEARSQPRGHRPRGRSRHSGDLSAPLQRTAQGLQDPERLAFGVPPP